ncbi:hypothetical protein OH710_25800 [Pseudomonas capsici]|nr:hypothetical protein [Pseudomonas capsici]
MDAFIEASDLAGVRQGGRGSVARLRQFVIQQTEWKRNTEGEVGTALANAILIGGVWRHSFKSAVDAFSVKVLRTGNYE